MTIELHIVVVVHSSMIFTIRLIILRNSLHEVTISRLKPHQVLNFPNSDFYHFSPSVTSIVVNKSHKLYIIRATKGFEASYKSITKANIQDILTDITIFNQSITDYNFLVENLNHDFSGHLFR